MDQDTTTSERKPFRFTSQAQYDFFQSKKPRLFAEIQAKNPVQRDELPARLGEKTEDVIYIPLGDGKRVYRWKV
jgi:hypothetical protein